MKIAWVVCGILSLGTIVRGQSLLRNGEFQAGATLPEGWRLIDGAGEWPPPAPGGTNRVVQVTGNGEDTSCWRTEQPLPLRPAALYSLRFRARRLPGANGGTAVAGTSRVNRDFVLTADWQEYGFVFRQPDDAERDFIRLGQWHVNGGVQFDGVQLLPVIASHHTAAADARDAGGLGTGERVQDGTYTFAPDFGWDGAAYHRPLWRNAIGFNSDRWVFTPRGELIYRFEIGTLRQTAGRIRVGINYHVAGGLEVAASRDGQDWLPLARLDGSNRTASCALPAVLFPAAAILVRLQSPEPNTGLQVNQLEYTASLGDAGKAAGDGATALAEVLHADPAVVVESFRLETTLGQGLLRLEVTARARLSGAGELEAELNGATVLATPDSKLTARFDPTTTVRPTVRAGQPGLHALRFSLRTPGGRSLLDMRMPARLSPLYDSRAGYPIVATGSTAVWWCESGWKVGRNSQAPGTNVVKRPVTVSAARGEYEAAQVFVRSEVTGKLVSVQAPTLRNDEGKAAEIQLAIHELAYVEVTRPTDSSGTADAYPDPLPPLPLPYALAAGQALPLWLTFHIGRNVAAGDYHGELELTFENQGDPAIIRVPLAVKVYDFEMPVDTHLRSALGLGSGAINRYHQLTNRTDRVAVFEKYLENFAQHRISPYSFYDYAPFEVRFEGEGTNKQARLDFGAFDAWASRWLDGKVAASDDVISRSAGETRPALSASPFNTFQLPLRGMGGGTFHERHLGELEGFQEGTPEHARLFQDYLGQVERHLREKGWLDKAFTYWFDEPDPKDYEFVAAGQRRIRAAAPGLKRMMTEQPEKELIGHVDIWCGLTPEWTPEKVRARREAGEVVWWYICTGPKAPYVTEFIDHPGTELRLWPWQSWQYGVSGILVWATLWWHSPTAYPDELQDPWLDPMSWTSGYGTPSGTRSPWGNGDGRFLYPPRRNPNIAGEPCLDGPINSMRWENLRDGMEDYEYFWLLDSEVSRVGALNHGGNRTPDAAVRSLLEEAQHLLRVPENVSIDLTHFTTDPRPILEHRDKLARLIERLQGVR